MYRIEVRTEARGYGALALEAALNGAPEPSAVAYAWGYTYQAALDDLLAELGLSRLDVYSRPERAAAAELGP